MERGANDPRPDAVTMDFGCPVGTMGLSHRTLHYWIDKSTPDAANDELMMIG